MTRVDAINGCPSAICFELRPPTRLRLSTLAIMSRTMIVMRILMDESASQHPALSCLYDASQFGFKRKAARSPEPLSTIHVGTLLDELCESDSRIRHAAGEAPLVVVPGQDFDHVATDHFRVFGIDD